MADTEIPPDLLERAEDFLLSEKCDDGVKIADLAAFAQAEVEREREACARLAENVNDCCECSDRGCCKGSFCVTAAAIRARGGEGK